MHETTVRDEHDGTLRYKDVEIRKRVEGKSLDVGCGKLKHGDVGIDVVDFPPVDVVIEEGEEYPFEDDSFDTVVCSEVLQQLNDSEASFVIGEMKRVVKPEGKLLISVPNSGNIIFRLGLWKQENNLGTPHKNFWNMRTFERFLVKNGLSVTWKKRSWYRKNLIFPFLSTCMIFEASPT